MITKFQTKAYVLQQACATRAYASTSNDITSPYVYFKINDGQISAIATDMRSLCAYWHPIKHKLNTEFFVHPYELNDCETSLRGQGEKDISVEIWPERVSIIGAGIELELDASKKIPDGVAEFPDCSAYVNTTTQASTLPSQSVTNVPIDARILAKARKTFRDVYRAQNKKAFPSMNFTFTGDASPIIITPNKEQEFKLLVLLMPIRKGY